MYEEVECDINICARIGSISESWASAGIMLRKSLDFGSEFSALTIENDHSGFNISRIEEYTPNEPIAIPSLNNNGWVRLVKQGDTIESMISLDGHSWSTILVEQLDLGERYLVGLVGTTVESSPLTEIIFENVLVQ